MHKKSFLSSVLVVVMAMPTAALPSDDTVSVCKSFSKGAGTIMEIRQAGVSMSDVMQAYVDTSQEGDSPTVGRAVELMITLAYETPRYSSESIQKRQVTEFENDFFLLCFKKYKKKD